MASSYAALVSLMNVLHIIIHPKHPASHLHKPQIQSLFDKVNSVVQLLETHSHRISKDLETKMKYAAFAAEDTIESYLVGIQQPMEPDDRQDWWMRLTEWRPWWMRLIIGWFSLWMRLIIGWWSLWMKLITGWLSLWMRLIIGLWSWWMRLTGWWPWWMRLIAGCWSLWMRLITGCWSLWMRLTRSSVPAEILQSTVTVDETSFPLLAQHLDKAIQEMDLIIQEATLQIDQNNGEQDQLLSRGLVPDIGSTPVTRGDAVKIVGLEEETNRLIDQLTSHQSNRQTIPIVGMGGLGKTTLATSVYNHPRLRNRFDVKAWVTVSQDYTPRKIFAPLLRDIGVNDIEKLKEQDLGEKLHKALFGRRYLIIIDDIWDLKAWDVISRYCPDNNNSSRILLTTRILDVANRVKSCCPFDMQLLDVDRSWALLSKTVFEQEVCPPELENCGKKIAKNCKGLPLAIVVIGGLLKMSHRTRKHWESVGRNIRSIIGTGDNEHCMKILSLSYHQLPIHLKPCFLYMATFPEDHKIKVSKVTKLWAADGFLKPRVDGKTLDEVALECLTDLISRNLVIVNKRNHRGEIKRLTVHDLVRDLCIKEAQNEMFLYVDDGVADLPISIESQRRLVFHRNGSRHQHMPQVGLARSFIWFRKQHLPAKMSRLSLLRVIASLEGRSKVEDIMRLVNLRLLMLSIKKNSFSSISWALNLETLILDGAPCNYKLPVEIWNLWRLKHLIVIFRGFFKEIILPDPPSESGFVLENLQTLKGVSVLSDIVLDRIPNIKILHIKYGGFLDFGHCQKLEKLHFKARCLEGNYKFPSYLRKLILTSTRIPWENMTIVGSLPNLETLFLDYAFKGEEWKSVEGEFEKLTFLKISHVDLVRWIVEDSSHFPSLEHLELEWMSQLEEIPLVFGELMTLVSIKVENCSKSSVLVSAREILEEQQQGGNNDLTVEVRHSIPRAEYSMELVEELKGLPNDNFHVIIDKRPWPF